MDKKPFSHRQRNILLTICGLTMLAGFIVLFASDEFVNKNVFGEAIKLLWILITVSPLIPLGIFWQRIAAGEKQSRKDFISKALYIKKTACDLSLLRAAALKKRFKNNGTDNDAKIETLYKKRFFSSPNEMILIKDNASFSDIEILKEIFAAEKKALKGKYTAADNILN